MYFKCDPVCRLCFKEPETVAHTILSCPALHEPRSRFVPQLKGVLVEYDVPCTSDNILQAALHLIPLHRRHINPSMLCCTLLPGLSLSVKLILL